MTCYSMFLKDKKVEEELKEKHPNKTFGEISKEKAKDVQETYQEIYTEKKDPFRGEVRNKKSFTSNR